MRRTVIFRGDRSPLGSEGCCGCPVRCRLRSRSSARASCSMRRLRSSAGRLIRSGHNGSPGGTTPRRRAEAARAMAGLHDRLSPRPASASRSELRRSSPSRRDTSSSCCACAWKDPSAALCLIGRGDSLINSSRIAPQQPRGPPAAASSQAASLSAPTSATSGRSPDLVLVANGMK